MSPAHNAQKKENINSILEGLKHRFVKLFFRKAPSVRFLRLHETFRVTEGPTPKGRALWLNDK